MSEDQRVSRNAQEPEKTGPAGAERWTAYLDWLREDLIEGILALPPQEQRRSRLPSDWSPIELLNHLVHMEQRWFIWGFLGEAVAEPWGDWTVPEPWSGNDADAGPDARWAVGDHITAEHLAAQLRAVGERTRSVLRDHPLEARALTGGRFTEDPPTLEWICFHVLAEYARHAGQYDVVAELSRASSSAD
jgi:uncharacterized damage-inducible protein DinB